MSKEICRLCSHEMVYFATTRKRDYYRCPHCDSIQLKESHILPFNHERAVYDTHNNDIHDQGYQNFVSPITNYILNNINPNMQGLDFGAGPGPVIYTLLNKENYHINLYDPHYHPNNHVLNQQYDYIFACEVIEHFNQPRQTFDLLEELIKENGCWIFMTNVYDDSIDFHQWHYKNDETHVIFYTKKTLEYLKDLYGWKELNIDNRLIIYKKKTA